MAKDIFDAQKFKRGNVCRITYGSPMCSTTDDDTIVTDSRPEDVGREVIIEGSYQDLFGGKRKPPYEYSIYFKDTGSSLAWQNEDHMEFIEEGGEHLIKEAKRLDKEQEKKNKDINYIASRLESDEGLSSDSILVIFDLFHYKSSFLRNGEFFILFNEWKSLEPAVMHIYRANTLEECKKGFVNPPDSLEIIFNTFQEAKKFNQLNK